MTVTAIPVVPVRNRGSLGARGARMAPYTTARGDLVRPGCYGISDGGSITGDLIRHATGARAGHAFVYVGNGQVVEVAPPVVRIAPAASHPGAIWNVRCPLTAAQRDRICARALALVGRAYDYPAYTGFALRVLKVRDGAGLDPVFKADHWRVSSELVADCYAYAGIRLQPGLRDLSLSGPAGLDTWTARLDGSGALAS
jgi:cell wall-associated NlpC family hydrolase